MALTTHTALRAAAVGGLVPEDIMARVWDVSRIPLPFSDLIGADSHSNEKCDWIKDKLGAVDITNAVVDGADPTGDNNAQPTRVFNFSQISDKVVSASSRARDGRTLNMGDPYSYQVMMRQQELKRDIEAILLLNQKSAPDAGSTAGTVGGFDAWLTSNTSNGNTGSDGGFNTTTGIVDVATPGTKRALSETTIRDVCQQVYEAGGNPSVLMARPVVIRKLSAYMFSSSAQIATLSSDVREKRSAAVATGSVNIFITDFGIVLEMTANRLQQPTAAATSSLFIIDPEYVTASYLARPNVVELGKTGLSTKGQMYADYSLKVMNEEAHGVIRAIDEALAVVA